MADKKPEERTQDYDSVVTPAFVKHQPFLKRFLTRFLSNSHDIEDVVQDSYLKALCAEKSQEIHSPKAFLFRIARNEALKELRKKSRRITDYLEELDIPEESTSETPVEDLIVAKQRLGLFCQSALEMTPRCRKVFLMCKVYGFSYKEIASQLGISVSGVEKHVARGLEICNAYVDRVEGADHQETALRNTQNKLDYSNATSSNVTSFAQYKNAGRT